MALSLTQENAKRRASDLLRDHLSADQWSEWVRRGDFNELAHGRLYTIYGYGSVCTESRYASVYWMTVYPIDRRELPSEDIALVNLLLLRYDLERFWRTACLSRNNIIVFGAGRKKPIKPCRLKGCAEHSERA